MGEKKEEGNGPGGAVLKRDAEAWELAPGKRCPSVFVMPRAKLIDMVRASTSTARARITNRSACCSPPRSCTGFNNARFDARQPSQLPCVVMIGAMAAGIRNADHPAFVVVGIRRFQVRCGRGRSGNGQSL